jgi:hypothetical protein
MIDLLVRKIGHFEKLSDADKQVLTAATKDVRDLPSHSDVISGRGLPSPGEGGRVSPPISHQLSRAERRGQRWSGPIIPERAEAALPPAE